MTDDEQPRDEGGQFIPIDAGAERDDEARQDDGGRDDATPTADGGAERPPSRNFSEREVRAFLRELFEQTVEWRGASDGRRAMPPQSHGNARGDTGGSDWSESPAAGQVLDDDDVKVLEAAGYELRDVPRLAVGGERTSTDSYDLVEPEPADEDDPPERSVAEVLGVDDESDE